MIHAIQHFMHLDEAAFTLRVLARRMPPSTFKGLSSQASAFALESNTRSA